MTLSLQRGAPIAAFLMLALVVGCPAATDTPATPDPNDAPKSQPASNTASPGDGRTPGALEGLTGTGNYEKDGESIPQRLGVTRRFIRMDKTTIVRDPAVLKDGSAAFVVGRVAGNNGLFKMPLDNSAPGEMFLPTPRAERDHPLSIHNRTNWYIGIPRLFPDQKHLIFGASMMNPNAKYPNVIGVVSVDGGKISAVEALGVEIARTPDVHPIDPDTIIFAACSQIRVGKLKGRGDQQLESTTLLELKKAEGAKQVALCTVSRPRLSPDGKQIVFEVIGGHLHQDEVKKYGVPARANPGDYVLEIWIANADGTGIRRLMTDEGYAKIGGRIQTGGSREPEFSPDGTQISFAHGRKIVVVSPDGKRARVVASDNVDGTPIQFHEEDPTWIDNNTLVSSSRLANRDIKAPPGLAIIDLSKIPEDADARKPVAPVKPLPETPKAPEAPKAP